MNKFTEGEWVSAHVPEYANDDNAYVVMMEELTIACTFISGAASEEEAKANADLMAAAPNMFMALKAVVNTFSNLSGLDKGEASLVLEIVNEALTKAKGVSNG